MRFGFLVAQVVIFGVGLFAELTQPSPTLSGVATFMALNATEFRWNVIFFWLFCSMAFCLRLRSLPYGTSLAVLTLLPLAQFSMGYGEYAAAEAMNAEIGLWASPMHLLAAGLLPAGLLVLVFAQSGGQGHTYQVSASLSLLALALAGLGLLWNFYQTHLAEGWAWDWIETGPCWPLLALLWANHTWAKVGVTSPLSYIAFLCLSRTALMTSAHHLQSPQNTLPLDPLGVYSALTYGTSYASGGLGLSPGVTPWEFLLTPWTGALLFSFMLLSSLPLQEPTLGGHGMLSVQGWGRSYVCTLGLCLGLPFSQVASYSTLSALTMLVLGSAAPYVKTLHVATAAFFFAGVSSVWYIFGQAATQGSYVTWASSLEFKAATLPLTSCAGSKYCVLVVMSWHVQGLLFNRQRQPQQLSWV